MTKDRDTRIAITGISAILPGGENINECWETIRAGLDKISELPSDRLDVTAYYNPEKGVKDKIYCKQGGFIPDFDFDAREFGMNMLQVEDADTNQTLTLLKVKEAFEDAGIAPFTKEKKNIGVVLGIGGGQKASNEFYSRLNYVVVEKVLRKMGLPEVDVQNGVEKFKANFPEWRLDSFPGFLGNVTAGRCTNVFNLDGMNCVVDAACASSLIALKVAIDELLHGNCDEMICGATCTDNSVGMYMAFSKTPVFSTDSHLTAFDKDTKGMLIGEGSVMFVLKRYEDAVKAGDQIHGIIRGVASSSDGKASGIYSPTIEGQQLAIERAYEKAGVNPRDVTLVEGHGTGTPVGDRIELTALNNVFTKHGAKNQQIAVGSIKSQIGHLKAVAGFAGLVKVVMSLKHKTLPATINVKIPPALYDGTKVQDSKLYLNTGLRPWFTDGNKPRIAGVSSFGFGGANYHCVVEEAEHEQAKAYRMNELPVPVVVSAASSDALVKLVQSEIKALSTLSYAAYSTFVKKFSLKSIDATFARVGFIAKDVEQVADILKDIEAKLLKDRSAEAWVLLKQNVHYRKSGLNVNGKVAALFSGQGAQYVNMFSDVCMNWPSFRDMVYKMDSKSEKVCGVRTSAILYPRKPYDNEKELDNIEISSVLNAQITTVACSLGSYNLFQQAGFKADFVAGHSLGEFTSLYASGKVTAADLCELVCHRAKIMHANEGKKVGAMAAVIGAGADKVKIDNRGQDIWIANKNCPDQIVLTGSCAAIEQESEKLKKQFKVVRLNCSDAFHSPYMQSANKSFLDRLKRINIKNTTSPVQFSNISGKKYGSDAISALSEHMTSSVIFDEQITEMYNNGARVFVEFGPRNTLTKLAENILKDKSDVYTFAVNSTSKIDSESQLRECAMKMNVLGVQLNNFDPWAVDNRFKLAASEKKKTVIRMSAATYVSSKTLKERDRIMNDGKLVSLLTAGNSNVCGVKEIKVVDETKVNELKEQVEKLKQEKELVSSKLASALNDVDNLKTKIYNLESAARESDTNSVNSAEIEAIKKHRAMIVSMLDEYDKMIDTLSEGDSQSNRSDNAYEQKMSELKQKVGRDTPTTTTTNIPSSPVKINVVDADLLRQAESVVLRVLADKTGYDVDMIEKDMELETELGIDSIKRVEILSEVQNVLNIEAKDVDALSRTRTVGEVINAMKFEISAAGAVVSSDGKPALATKYSTSASSSLASKNSIDTTEVLEKPEVAAKVVPKQSSAGLLNKAEEAVMRVLAEKTGYDVEMIENDMELETELGIDSIKRVEILSEVQNLLNIEAKDVDALSRTRTVGEVIDAMKKELGIVSEDAHISNFTEPKKVVSAPSTSNATSAISGSAAALLKQAEDVVLKVLAEKTGYDVEMIETDMELETELGIDSIKRVEILSEVQNVLSIEATDVDALSRTRTVGEVINAMKNEISSLSASAISTPVVSRVEIVQITGKVGASNSSVLLAKAEEVVLKVLAEKTGYDVEMIEKDMELETELGIDSIKRVEILSEVQNLLSIEAKDVDALSRTRTVGEVINAMKSEIGQTTNTFATVSNVPAPNAEIPKASTNAKVSPDAVSKAKDVVLKVLAEKTGYDVEMIELDMELETELGIDSIKRVEILSEVQNLLNVEAKNVDALSRTRTVGEVIEAMKAELGGTVSSDSVEEKKVAVIEQVNKQPASINTGGGNAENVVMQVLAEKTGYEVDMIEKDMELETELGIDSIKRVEILSEVQNLLNIEAKDVDALSRTRTVGEVIAAMRIELGSSPVATISTTATETPKTIIQASVSVDLSKAEKVVLQVLAEKTGYDVEMIETDMELETELGIDSIKRVEILSEVQNLLSIEAKDVDALSRTRTVGEVIEAMKREIISTSAHASAPVAVRDQPATTVAKTSNNASTGQLQKAEEVVLQVLAEKTGYDVEMIEKDMELETELGIDSIKRVEILSEVQNLLSIEAKDVDALSRTRTVGEVIEAMKKELGTSGKAVSA